MKNIDLYRKRFYGLLESTMGDVKPLLNEQTASPLPWGIKSDWDGNYGSVSNAKEVFGPEIKDVDIFLREDGVYDIRYETEGTNIWGYIHGIPSKDTNQEHLNYVKTIISKLSKGFENSGFNDNNKESHDIVRNLKNFTFKYSGVFFDYPENQPNEVMAYLFPKDKNSTIEFLQNTEFLNQKLTLTVEYKNGTRKENVKIKIQDNTLYFDNQGSTKKGKYVKPAELTDVKDFQRWLDQNKSNWYPGIKGEGKGKSVDGIYGRYTHAAWNSYKNEYLNKDNQKKTEV